MCLLAAPVVYRAFALAVVFAPDGTAGRGVLTFEPGAGFRLEGTP